MRISAGPKKADDPIRATYYEQEMRMLQAERGRRHGNGNGYARHNTEKPLSTLADSVMCLDVHDAEALAFPEAAWTGLFAKWREIAAPCTEAPLESLWAAFLLTVGLLLGRDVWRSSPRPLYPNFYELLLGKTGDSRKSTVIWLAEELLQR